MNLKGGYKIIKLPVMEIDEDSVTITDKGLLEQLETLKGYMGNKELKPILIHAKIEEDSEIIKHCVMGALIKVSETEYVISGKIGEAYLTISVEFTQDEETGEYYIASGDATYVLTDGVEIAGDLKVAGYIKSATGISTPANVDALIGGDLGVTGDASIGSDLSVNGAIKIGETNIKNIFVKIMDAPTSTTLTVEQIAQFKEGVFINGNFLGFHNPIICPCYAYDSSQPLTGFLIGKEIGQYGRSVIAQYSISFTTNIISVLSYSSIIMGYRGASEQGIKLNTILSINNKNIPAYPSDTGTFTLKMVNGVLTWVQDV